MLSAKFTGLNAIIEATNRFYGKLLIANESTAEYARQLVLDRVSSGRTTTNKKMSYRGKKRIGDYSKSWGNTRKGYGLSDKPFSLKYTGALHKAYRYKKSVSKRFSLTFYIANTNARSGFSHKQLVAHFNERFNDNIFLPSQKEFNLMRRHWRNQAK